MRSNNPCICGITLSPAVWYINLCSNWCFKGDWKQTHLYLTESNLAIVYWENHTCLTPTAYLMEHLSLTLNYIHFLAQSCKHYKNVEGNGHFLLSDMKQIDFLGITLQTFSFTYQIISVILKPSWYFYIPFEQGVLELDTNILISALSTLCTEANWPF